MITAATIFLTTTNNMLVPVLTRIYDNLQMMTVTPYLVVVARMQMRTAENNMLQTKKWIALAATVIPTHDNDVNDAIDRSTSNCDDYANNNTAYNPPKLLLTDNSCIVK